MEDPTSKEKVILLSEEVIALIDAANNKDWSVQLQSYVTAEEI